MAGVRGGTAGARAGRGRTRWGVFAVVMALPTLLVAGVAAVAIWFMTSDYPLGGEPEDVPCAEALDFGGAKLPKGAYDGQCTVQTWLDTDYHAAFRMPRADVRKWLADTYPEAPEPGTDLCDTDADLCLNLNTQYATPPDGAGADAVTVNVTYEDAGTAVVFFSAFTV
ncbi:hypothetical protein [Streptomyces brasiliensis]|uniref:Uncharacterized protein n=1 Tax=Streptomyces brasiliensis TaxID=1954 RepID=A0A917P2Q2_9ACTN|nr:hypothetical protein [Streptomyces brasiliensis]GGJ49842.1 hypothetical protein GCM10010121_071220 [Streptomyces brasiliensis]